MILKKYLKLLLILTISFIISDFSIKNLFLAQSPKFNPFFVSNTIAKVNNFWLKTKNFIASINFFPRINFQNTSNITNNQITNNQLNNQQNNFQPNNFAFSESQINDILKAPLKKVSQGVYAGEKNGYKIYEIRTGEIEYIEYTFNVNGKEVKIKVPKGEEPPSQEVVEALYK